MFYPEKLNHMTVATYLFLMNTFNNQLQECLHVSRNFEQLATIPCIFYGKIISFSVTASLTKTKEQVGAKLCQAHIS